MPVSDPILGREMEGSRLPDDDSAEQGAMAGTTNPAQSVVHVVAVETSMTLPLNGWRGAILCHTAGQGEGQDIVEGDGRISRSVVIRLSYIWLAIRSIEHCS